MKRSMLFWVISSGLLASCGGGNKPSQPMQPVVTDPAPQTKPISPPIQPPVLPNVPPTPCTTCSSTPAPSTLPPVVPRPTVQIPQTIEVPTNIGSKLSADEVKTLLTLHNQARTEVGVSGLNWSSDAAAYIQNWVDQLAAEKCSLEHRQPNQYGENLFMGSIGYGVGEAVKMWESEKKAYHGESNNFSNVGHYTQMVWRSTTQVGCATANCSGMVIIGCNYHPAGNMMGQKPY